MSDEEYSEGDYDGEPQERERKQGMHWLNEPEEWSQHRTTVMMRAAPGTDFWRKTVSGFLIALIIAGILKQKPPTFVEDEQ